MPYYWMNLRVQSLTFITNSAWVRFFVRLSRRFGQKGTGAKRFRFKRKLDYWYVLGKSLQLGKQPQLTTWQFDVEHLWHEYCINLVYQVLPGPSRESAWTKAFWNECWLGMLKYWQSVKMLEQLLGEKTLIWGVLYGGSWVFHGCQPWRAVILLKPIYLLRRPEKYSFSLSEKIFSGSNYTKNTYIVLKTKSLLMGGNSKQGLRIIRTGKICRRQLFRTVFFGAAYKRCVYRVLSLRWPTRLLY